MHKVFSETFLIFKRKRWRSAKKMYFCENFTPMYLNFKEIATVTLALFPIIDIIGNLPVIISLTEKFGKINAEKSTIVAGLIMIIFLFLGQGVLYLMDIPVEAFAVGGAFILFILAVEMLLGVEFHKTQIPESVSIIPIAFPLLAGPGVLTTILSLSYKNQEINIIVAILLNMILVYFGMKFSKFLGNLLGATGIVILHKVSGIILLALAIKLFAENWTILLK